MTPVETALREAEEEIGLESHLVEVVSVLPQVASGWVNLTSVAPVVCLLNCDVEELRLSCNPEEVVQIAWIPIRTFLDSDTMELIKGKWGDSPITSASFHYVDLESKSQCFVWGLTAQICITVSAIALNRKPSFFPHGGYGLVDVQYIDSKTIAAVMKEIALTSEQLEQWRRSVPKVYNCRVSISQWNDNLTVTAKL